MGYSHFKNGETQSGLTFACTKGFRREYSVTDLLKLPYILGIAGKRIPAHYG
jgi:hypothetical protein